MRALAEDQYLLVEAGTGTGKTLAYLVPAIVSGRKVVVSTGTKNLQEQIYHKDLPFLRERFFPDLRAAYMKGRGNYLCLRRFHALRDEMLLPEAALPDSDWAVISAWAESTETGDRAELTGLPENHPLWPEICATADNCLGQRCPLLQKCFITRMKAEAYAADLVVVNHHLFCADLAVRGNRYAEVIPRYQAVIFDEAHQLEEVATNFFGLQVSSRRLSDLVGDLLRQVRRRPDKLGEMPEAVEGLDTAARTFFQLVRRAIRGRRDNSVTRERYRAADVDERLRENHGRLKNRLIIVYSGLGRLDPHDEESQALAERARSVEEDLDFLAAADEPSYVFWRESRSGGVFLNASPIDVSREFETRLYPELRSAVYTSATLSVSGGFTYLKSRLGLGDWAEELIVPSPFDYARQAVLYVPPHLPQPRHPEFTARAAEEIEALLELSEGRAFVLFTSYRNLHAVHDLLKDRVAFPLLVQGERPRTAMLDYFRRDVHSVLLATASFWEGVDVPGESLSCVIVDKLPFAAPDDPLVEARIEFLRDRGEDPFYSYQLPQAIIALRQGLGRLIRGRTDRGILAVLDARLLSRGYGRRFLESLPPCRCVHTREELTEAGRALWAEPPADTTAET